MLLVEDNLISQQLLRDLLEKTGHTVTVAANGEDALAALERDSFDVMLLDVQMPGMSGLEVSAHIRAKERTVGGHLPIIALTAHAMHGDRERCIEAGMDDYVPKPIQMHELWSAIKHVLKSEAVRRVIQESGIRNQESAISNQQTGAKKPAQMSLTPDSRSRTPDSQPLLAKMARIFLDVCPEWQATLHRAVAAGDARMVEVTAHTVRGSAAHFAAEAACDAALRLELMARKHDLADAPRALGDLDDALAGLRERLGELASR
jgi:CheY-like chemotaxis protein